MKNNFPIKLALAGLAAFIFSAGVANPAFAAPNERGAKVERHAKMKSAKKPAVAKQRKESKRHKRRAATRAHVRHHQTHRRCAHGHKPKGEPVLVKRTVRAPGRPPVVTYTR